MAQNTNISCASRTWTQLTNSDVSAMRIQNTSGFNLLIKATVGATPPSTTDGAIEIEPYKVLAADLTLAQMFPGVAGANRVYAYTNCLSAVSISISHA